MRDRKRDAFWMETVHSAAMFDMVSVEPVLRARGQHLFGIPVVVSHVTAVPTKAARRRVANVTVPARQRPHGCNHGKNLNVRAARSKPVRSLPESALRSVSSILVDATRTRRFVPSSSSSTLYRPSEYIIHIYGSDNL